MPGRTDLLRFIDTYRWELWLIVGIPAAAWIAFNLVSIPLQLLLDSARTFSNLQLLLGSVVALLLLAVFYGRVRGLGRDFLPLLWGYVLITSAISAIAAVAALIAGVEYSDAPQLTVIGSTLLIYGLAALLQLIALLWFSRQASKLSLTHAFFLVAIASPTLLGSMPGSQSAENFASVLALFLAGGAIALVVALFKVWLLGNFDLRGSGFRRNAVVGFVTAVVLSGLATVVIDAAVGSGEGTYSDTLPLLGVVSGLAAFIATTGLYLLTLFILFAIVYLVRARQSPADTPPAPR